MQGRQSASVFKDSAEIRSFASASLFGSDWKGETFRLLERVGFSDSDLTDNPFYHKALWQRMQSQPVVRRMATVAKKLMGLDLSECSAFAAVSEIKTAGLVFRVQGEEAFWQKFDEIKAGARSYASSEHLAAELTVAICHSVIPGLVIKPGSVKEAMLWAMLRAEQVPWNYVELAFGAGSDKKRKALSRTIDRTIATLVPECRDGGLDRIGRLRAVCKKIGLCQRNEVPSCLAKALRAPKR